MAADVDVHYDLPIFRSGPYYVRVLADSTSPEDVRLTTIEARYPRFIHAEVLRHRVDSHSVESSRARPLEDRTQSDGSVVKGTLTHVREDPFIPATFNQRVAGMGVGEEFDERTRAEAERAWRRAAESAVDYADFLNRLGLDKSRANRLLEPFMWVKDIISATEWSNFLALRCPPGNTPDMDFPAQLEFQQFSILVRQALQMSKPENLKPGWWHLPGATRNELAELCDLRMHAPRIEIHGFEMRLKLACARRLARVSFDKHDRPEAIDISVNKAGELVSSGHFSPFEHIARPMAHDDLFDGSPLQDKILIPASEVSRTLHTIGQLDFEAEENEDRFFTNEVNLRLCWAGNFRGWVQHRKEYVGEEDHAMLLDYPVL